MEVCIRRVSLKFSVRDKYNNPVSVQQAFVRVAPAAPAAAAPADLEAIYVAEPSAKTYKIELVSTLTSVHICV